MQNLGIVTFNDNIDSIIKARQCISSNNIIVFVKEEHERDIQRCNKGTDIHIKFLREIEDYRGKLDMLMFLSAPVDFVYSKVSIAPKIAVTNNILLQLGNYKIESTMHIGNHMFLVIEPLPIKKEAVEIKVASEVLEEIKKVAVADIVPTLEIIVTKHEIETIIDPPVIEKVIEPIVEEKKEEIIVEAPVEMAIESELIVEVKEEIIEIEEEVILSSEPVTEIAQTPEVEIIEPVVETTKEAVIEAKEMSKKKGRKGRR